MTRKTYYYHDPKKDDFAATKIDQIQLSEDYLYNDRRPLYLIGETLIRFIAFPFLFLILKVGYLQRVHNLKAFRQVKGQGFYLFGNHTNYMLDAYNPSVLLFPKRAQIIANPDAVSIKGIGLLVKMLGAIPIPTSRAGMSGYLKGIEEMIRRGHAIMIYPEAHIWPYYTDIRPFGTESFHYAADGGIPCFTLTNIYCKRRFPLIKRPKVVTYVDGPFYPDMTLHKKDRTQKLRDEIYNAMKARVDANPRYDYCEYVYVENEKLTNRKS